MAVLRQVSPIFSVVDVEASLAFYTSLGFRVRRWSGGGYGFAALAVTWRAAGATVHGPEDTPWGMHEGVLVDPDGNTIRFGNPL